MSVIQTLRGKLSTLVLVLLIIALVGFLVMDSAQNISNIFGTDRTLMGNVNGERIEKADFDNRLSDYENQLMLNNPKLKLSEDDRSGLRDQMWNQMLSDGLLKEEYEKLGIDVSNAEFKDMFAGPMVDAQLKQNFTDPNTGIFDQNKLIQVVQQKEADKDPKSKQEWLKTKQGMLKERMNKKLVNLFSKAIYIPAFVLDEENGQKNKIAKISYVMVPYTSITDNITVGNDEILTYLKARGKAFAAKEDNVNFEYVSFPIVPSPADTAASLGVLNKLLPQFVASADPISFASDNSDELVSEKYFNEKNYENTNKEAILNAPIGTMIGPYYDNGAYKLTKVLQRKTLPDSVRVSQIVAAVSETRNEKQAEATIDSLLDQLKTVDFAQLAATRSDDPEAKNNGGDVGYLTYELEEGDLKDFAFNGAVGEVKKLKLGGNFFLIKITEQKSFKPNVQVATISKEMAPGTETANKVNNTATQFAAACKDEASFKEQIKKFGVDKRIAQSVKRTQTKVEGLGNVRQLVRWAFDSKTGTFSSVFVFDDKCVIARVVSKTEKGEIGNGGDYRGQIEALLLKKKRAEAITAKAKGISDLNGIAQKFGLPIKTSDSIVMSAYAPSPIGYETRVGAAAANPQYQKSMSPGIPGEQGVYFIKVDQFVDNSKTVPRMIELERLQMSSQLANSAQQLLPELLKNKAKIEDLRYNHY